MDKKTRKALAHYWMYRHCITTTNRFYAIADILDKMTHEYPEDHPERIAFRTAMHNIRDKPRRTLNSTCHFPGLLNVFHRDDEDGTYWRTAFLVEGTDPERVLTAMCQAGIPIEGEGSRGPGDAYSNDASAYVVGENRILVTQSGGLDV